MNWETQKAQMKAQRDLAYGQGYADGRWEMFISITNAYFGKQYYFVQDNGKVYSRQSGEYLTHDEAVNEFLKEIGEE